MFDIALCVKVLNVSVFREDIMVWLESKLQPLTFLMKAECDVEMR